MKKKTLTVTYKGLARKMNDNRMVYETQEAAQRALSELCCCFSADEEFFAIKETSTLATDITLPYKNSRGKLMYF